MPRRKWPGRGLASMSLEKRREIASMGAKAAHTLGVAHTWTSEEASRAGKKGGATTATKRKREAALRKSR